MGVGSSDLPAGSLPLFVLLTAAANVSPAACPCGASSFSTSNLF